MKKLAALITAVVAGTAGSVASAATLDVVRERGFVNCGVGENFAGFFAPDNAGKWSGLDVDVCRALSAAIFGAPDKVKYLPATPATRFAQLQSGQVDLLSRSVTWTLARDGVHADRNDDGAEPRRLFPLAFDEVHPGRVRDDRPGRRGLRSAALRRLH